jgi:hypothetical protein
MRVGLSGACRRRGAAGNQDRTSASGRFVELARRKARRAGSGQPRRAARPVQSARPAQHSSGRRRLGDGPAAARAVGPTCGRPTCERKDPPACTYLRG